MNLGTVKNISLETNVDSEKLERVLGCTITSDTDPQSVELANNAGEDIVPLEEDVVVVMKISDAYKLGILIDDGVARDGTLQKGEKEIYSRSAPGVKSATLKLDKTGQIILNSGIDFAVAFNALKAKLDALQVQLLAHVHPGVLTGGASTLPSITPFDADISAAKVEKVRL